MNSKEKKELTFLYINQDLTTAEVAQYESLLKSDSELRTELNLQKAIDKGLREMVLNERLKLFRSEFEAELENKFKSGTKMTLQRTIFRYGIAATVLILLGVSLWFYNSKQTNQELFAIYFKEEVHQKPFDPEIMGASKENSYYKELTTTAISDLKAGKMDDCIRKLRQVQNEGNSYWNQVAEWYLALAYLKTNENTKAVELFKKISEDSSHIYQKDANLVRHEISDKE